MIEALRKREKEAARVAMVKKAAATQLTRVDWVALVKHRDSVMAGEREDNEKESARLAMVDMMEASVANFTGKEGYRRDT